MAYSYTTYTGNGSTTQYAVAFGYIRREHVAVTVAGSAATFTWVNSSLIQMDAAPANGAAVLVYRTTPLAAPLVDFADGATLVAADLDTNARQSIYTQQELDDSLIDGLAGVIPNGDKGDIVTSLGGTVWTIDTGAVTEAKVGTGAITETKIGTGAVTETKVATGAVSAAKIATGAFTNSVSSTSTTTIATPNSVKTAYDLATTANTAAGVAQGDATSALSNAAAAQSTANAALPKAGGTMTGVITYDAAQPRLVAGTSQASTSGTSIDFPSIPSWVKRITVMFQGVSTSAGSPVLIQLGTGSTPTYTTSGYLGSVLLVDAAGATARTTYTTGFLVVQDSANSHVRHGNLTITNITGNSWTQTGILARSDDTSTHHSAGSIALAAVLTAVRITTVVGANTFDLGSINILYEG